MTEVAVDDVFALAGELAADGVAEAGLAAAVAECFEPEWREAVAGEVRDWLAA